LVFEMVCAASDQQREHGETTVQRVRLALGKPSFADFSASESSRMNAS
jgi:hypothetical protein